MHLFVLLYYFHKRKKLNLNVDMIILFSLILVTEQDFLRFKYKLIDYFDNSKIAIYNQLYKIYFFTITKMAKNTSILLISLIFLLFSSNFAAITINQLTGISSNNLVYSGLLPISDTSADQLFFTYYSANNAKQ